MTQKTIFLDRDNTLINDPGYLDDPDKVEILPGVLTGLKLLYLSGYQLIVVTNQSGVGRGLFNIEIVYQIHEKIRFLCSSEGIKIKKFYICPHTDADNCDCRKPAPGLIQKALKEMQLKSEYCWIIGDRLRDLQAGQADSIKGILIGQPEGDLPGNFIYQAGSFTDAVTFLMQFDFDLNLNQKIYTDGSIPDAVNQGKTVFTNGCFDILHPGHLQYLSQARNLGDRLYLGLNSDESVKKLKGKNRPINSFRDRALILAAFSFIDAVIEFKEQTPEVLIDKIKPDIHVKGGDYEATLLPEYQTVKKHGGDVVILPFRKGYSTTSIIKKMNS